MPEQFRIHLGPNHLNRMDEILNLGCSRGDPWKWRVNRRSRGPMLSRRVACRARSDAGKQRSAAMAMAMASPRAAGSIQLWSSGHAHAPTLRSLSPKIELPRNKCPLQPRKSTSRSVRPPVLFTLITHSFVAASQILCHLRTKIPMLICAHRIDLCATCI